MKTSIMSLMAAATLMAATASGCSGQKGSNPDNSNASTQAETANADLRGQWLIENIVFSDSDYVRPSEAVPGSTQYVVFEDSTFFIMTNCNTISGSYSTRGDSIALDNLGMTELACDNMQTEDALRHILPRISTLDVQSDSVVRLNGSTPAECILLLKARTPIK